MNNPFHYYNSSPEVIRFTVMMVIRYPLSAIRHPLSSRQVEDVLFDCGIDISYETVRFWWNRFGPMFADEMGKRRVEGRNWLNWRWHLDEVLSVLTVRHTIYGALSTTKGRCLRSLPRNGGIAGQL